MRKNGVNRELQEIDGGVCAPVGFRANGVCSGFTVDEEKKDLALIVADRRCPTACVYSTESKSSGPASTTKRHMKRGLGRAILCNSGVANVFLPEGERLAEMACRTLAACSDIDCNDTAVASTGVVGARIELETFEKGMRPLVQGLTATVEGSTAAAEAIATVGAAPMQAAFTFDLGDFPCKIGGVFKGNMHVCPNVATTLIFLTTDVNISSEMLQKALSLTVKDTVNLLACDGTPSPNDMVCIMASGKAGNYKISYEDTEFSKFTFALRKVLFEICCRIAAACDKQGRVFTCKVTGAKSQQSARAIAKNLLSSPNVRRVALRGVGDVESILYAANQVADGADFATAQIALAGGENRYVLFSDGYATRVDGVHLRALSEGEELSLQLALNDGNYSAIAIGCLEYKEN